MSAMIMGSIEEKGGERMLTIQGTPQEIAAFVFELQERQVGIQQGDGEAPLKCGYGGIGIPAACEQTSKG